MRSSHGGTCMSYRSYISIWWDTRLNALINHRNNDCMWVLQVQVCMYKLQQFNEIVRRQSARKHPLTLLANAVFAMFLSSTPRGCGIHFEAGDLIFHYPLTWIFKSFQYAFIYDGTGAESSQLNSFTIFLGRSPGTTPISLQLGSTHVCVITQHPDMILSITSGCFSYFKP
jgi:hypothetical protein